MAVSYPLTMPAGLRSARFELVSNTAAHVSPRTKAAQVVERQGALWRATFKIKPMKRADAAAWTAFFASLRGMYGTFYAYDPAATSPLGSAPGTPLVKGASQTGHSLITDGWGLSESDILKAGDYIQLGDWYYMNVTDASSDGVGTGESTLEIEPQLRESPADNLAITTAAPKAIMRLGGNIVGWDEDVAQLYGFSFSAIENIT
jgi:hypothetical protein